MKIVVITAWGDEHLIAPYFCRHYDFADEVIVLMGPGISDETVEVCNQFPNVQVRELEYPNGKWDMNIKQKELTKTAHSVDADWVILVDADEFVFPCDGGIHGDPERWCPFRYGFKQALSKIDDGNVVMAAMWHVYRHVSDRDLDPAQPPLFQRRHGDPKFEHHYIKPIIVKPNDSKIEWHIGAHRFFKNDSIRVSKSRFYGVHWHWADVDMAIERHRMVASRIIDPQRWLTDATDEQKIRERCEAHRNDPRLF